MIGVAVIGFARLLSNESNVLTNTYHHMEYILDFTKHANSTMLICLCLIIIILLLLDKYKVLFKKIFRKQDLTNFKIEGQKTTMEDLAKQLTTIATNHLHGLPEISKNVEKIIATVENIQKIQVTDGNRLSKIEGYLKINI